MSWLQFVYRGALGKRLPPLAAAAFLIGLAVVGWFAWRAHGGLEKAKALAHLELWGGVRIHLERYIWWRPGDDQARLMLAEALVKDDVLSAQQAVPKALTHLKAVDEHSPWAAPARLQEGRLELLLMYRPARAEKALRAALLLDDQLAEAHYLLWKDFGLTGRYYHAEPHFWSVYELTPKEQRASLLREWYMSQFYPTTAHGDFERSIGLLPPDESPSRAMELQRYLAFVETEPDAPLGYAAAGHWWQQSGNPEQGIEILDQFLVKNGREPTEPFWLAAKIACLIDLGRTAEADAYFQRWPQPHIGFDYWKARASVLDEARGEHHQALSAYDHALAIWPGPIDWRLRFRKANCLARAGKQELAAQERTRAKAMEVLNQESVHIRLRELLGNLRDPMAVQEIVAFYRKINRPREAVFWTQQITKVRKTQ